MEPYIKKSDIIAEIERRINANNEMAASFSNGSEHDYLCRVKEKVYKDLLSFLNTFETKEVDLVKEIHKYMDIHGLHTQDGGRIVFANGDTPNFLCDFRDIAKHFFELGLAQKG